MWYSSNSGDVRLMRRIIKEKKSERKRTGWTNFDGKMEKLRNGRRVIFHILSRKGADIEIYIFWNN